MPSAKADKVAEGSQRGNLFRRVGTVQISRCIITKFLAQKSFQGLIKFCNGISNKNERLLLPTKTSIDLSVQHEKKQNGCGMTKRILHRVTASSQSPGQTIPLAIKSVRLNRPQQTEKV